MVNQEKLNKVYEILIKDEELTTSKLRDCGFNSNDITKLVSNKVIERSRRGHYTLLDVEHMHQYGKYLITQKNYDKAKKCLEKCYELNSKHSGNCFALFVNSIMKNDYKAAFKYFEGFYKKDDYYAFSKRNDNFYLFLLNLITTIPEKYKGYVEQLELEDILVSNNDKCKQNIPLHNEIRTFAFNQRFKQAVQTYERLVKINGKTYSDDVVAINLLNSALESQKSRKRNILNLVTNKDYIGVVSYIESVLKMHEIDLLDKYVLKLTKELLEIKETKQIPEKINSDNSSIFAAINNKDYELALSLTIRRDKKREVDSNNNSLYLILREINNTIKEISSLDDINQLPLYLNSIDFNTSIIILDRYLEKINKDKYEHLIIDFIKLDMLDKDTSFKRTLNILNDLKSDDFKLDIDEQFINCYKSLGERNFEKARLYFDISSTLNKLYNRNIKLSGLENVICICEKNNNLSTVDTPNEKNYYGVKKMPKIFKLIELGTTFENVCKFIDLNPDEKNIAALLIAKEYYTRKLYDIGDSYLDKVSNEIIESDLVFALLHITRLNKYKYSKNKDDDYESKIYVKNNK